MNEGREIFCHKCKIYLGIIRDATLRKGIQHACYDCAVGKKPIDPTVDGLRKLFGM